MKAVNQFLDMCRAFVRALMQHVAVFLNTISKGAITPNSVTVVGLAAHVPIAILIAFGQPYWAAGLLLVFGLFDALDGALARLQGRTSAGGMLLDASTDRMKETLLYSGITAYFVAHGQTGFAAWTTAALGASICVSYVKAKGETAVSKSHLTVHELNRLFQDGFLRFELRMALLIIGLVTGWLPYAVVVIAIFAAITAFDRLFKIMRHLDVQS